MCCADFNFWFREEKTGAKQPANEWPLGADNPLDATRSVMDKKKVGPSACNRIKLWWKRRQSRPGGRKQSSTYCDTDRWQALPVRMRRSKTGNRFFFLKSNIELNEWKTEFQQKLPVRMRRSKFADNFFFFKSNIELNEWKTEFQLKLPVRMRRNFFFFFGKIGMLNGMNENRLPDEFRVEFGGEQRFGQLPQVKFQNIGDHVRVNVSQINQIGAVLECLAQLLHFGLDAGHSVQTLNTTIHSFTYDTKFKRIFWEMRRVFQKTNRKGPKSKHGSGRFRFCRLRRVAWHPHSRL